MYVIGKWCERVDTPEGLKAFQASYKMTPEDYIVRYELDTITLLTPENFPHLVFLEYDGLINQLFSLQEGDVIEVNSQGRTGAIFNTDGMMFFHLLKSGIKTATFCAQNSPYDLEGDDFLEEEFEKSKLMERVQQVLCLKPDTYPVTESNVLYVRQL